MTLRFTQITVEISSCLKVCGIYHSINSWFMNDFMSFGLVALVVLHQMYYICCGNILKQYSKTQPEVIPKFSCDVLLANGELHQACGHVLTKDGNILLTSISCSHYS